MATSKKVTFVNHLPGEGNDRFPIYSKQFNELVDDILYYTPFEIEVYP